MKRKKFFVLIVSLVLIIIVFRQVYFYYKYDGNLVIYVSNHSNIDTVNFDVYINKELKISESSNNNFHIYKEFSLNSKIGTNSIKVVFDEKYQKEINVNIFPVRFIYIEFTGQTDDTYFINTFKSYSPLRRIE